MAPKHKLSSNDTKAEKAEQANSLGLAFKFAQHNGLLRRSKRLKTSAIKPSRSFARLSHSGHDSLFRSVNTEGSPLGVIYPYAQAHSVDSVNLDKKSPPTRPTEGSRTVTPSPKLPQRELFTTHPDQSPYYRQRDNNSTSYLYAPNKNGLLDSSATLRQKPATNTPGNRLGYLNLTLPSTVSLTERTSNHKPSGKHKQGRQRLLELPLDIWCLIEDHLDVVARACLRFTALGYWSKGYLSNLSPCARSAIVSLLLRDGASMPKELFAVAAKGTNEGQCSEYQKNVPKYCVICRCWGHLARCPGCQIRTCAREDTEFWHTWTGVVDDDTPFSAGNQHSNP